MASLRARLQVLGLQELSNSAYELLDRPKKFKKRKLSDIPLPSVNDAWPKDETEARKEGDAFLAARRLPKASKPRSIWRVALVTGLAAVIIIGLSILIKIISKIDTRPEDDVITGRTTTSCDLLASNVSAIESAFYLNLRGAAHLSYFQARVIDVFWQLLVGAGGRLLLGWIAYIVFMDGLVRLMESTPLSYETYASIAFSTNSIYSTWFVLKGVFSTSGWRGKAFLTWFVLSSLYMLGFPNIISITGGYLAPSSTRLAMPDGSYISSDSNDLTNCYAAEVGELIGLPENHTVILGPQVKVAYTQYGTYSAAGYKSPDWALQYPLYFLLMNDSYPLAEVDYHFLNGTVKKEYSQRFHYKNDDIEDIEEWYKIANNGRNYTVNDTTIRDLRVDSYCYKNQSIGLPSFSEVAKCQPAQYFVWGLSSLMILVLLGLQVAWTVGMYGVWIDANLNSVLCRNGRRIRGPFRAVADLAEAIKEVVGDQICAYPESELAEALRRQPGLRFYSDAPAANGIAHIGLSSMRLRRVVVDDSVVYGTKAWQR